MIKRYSTPDTDALFSEEAKMSRWLEIELAVTDALAATGVVPKSVAEECRRKAPAIDAAFVARVEAREAITNHDVAAFVDVLQESIGFPAGSYIHHGLTSTDVVDTGWCWALRDAMLIILDEMTQLLAVTTALAHEHRDTLTIGRTHGIHAEPTTFGLKLAGRYPSAIEV